MMETGSAIPASLDWAQNLPGFRFQSSGFGIYNVSIPHQVGWNVNYNGPNDTRGTGNPVYDGSYNFTFSISWASQVQTRATGLVTDDVNPRFITYLNTTQEQILANRIKEIAYFARDSKACSDAFKAAGAVPVGEQINNVTIVTQNVFSNPDFDSSWAPDDGGNFANQMRETLAQRTGYFRGVTTNDISQVGEYMNRRFIGLTNRAIAQTDDFLDVSVVHSFVHSGGIAGIESPRTWTQLFLTGTRFHDLNFLGVKYDDIIKNCTVQGFSRAPKM